MAADDSGRPERGESRLVSGETAEVDRSVAEYRVSGRRLWQKKVHDDFSLYFSEDAMAASRASAPHGLFRIKTSPAGAKKKTALACRHRSRCEAKRRHLSKLGAQKKKGARLAQLKKSRKKNRRALCAEGFDGGKGVRTLDISHAKRALYH